MKVIFMGTPDFAVGALEAVIRGGHEVAAVVTQPDKPKGRGKTMQLPPVKQCAVKYGIEVLQPVKIKMPESVAALREYQADIFIVAAFGQLLSEEILTMPKYGCINIHASLLPKYRGAAPIQWVILNGEKETGITIMQMDRGLDTGDMLLKSTVPIEERETGETLHDKLSAVGAELILQALTLIEKGELIPEKQCEEDASYFSLINKELGRIDWTKDAVSIDRLVRGLNSRLGAYTYISGKLLKLWEVWSDAQQTSGMPGTIAKVSKEAFYVNTGKGLLKVTEVQPEGKRRMKVKDFLLGYPITEGMLFDHLIS